MIGTSRNAFEALSYSDETGSFKVTVSSEAPLVLYCRKPGYADCECRVEVENLKGRAVECRLLPSHELTGRVLGDSGVVSGVWIWLRDDKGRLVATALSGEDGGFVFTGVSSGRYSLTHDAGGGLDIERQQSIEVPATGVVTLRVSSDQRFRVDLHANGKIGRWTAVNLVPAGERAPATRYVTALVTDRSVVISGVATGQYYLKLVGIHVGRRIEFVAGIYELPPPAGVVVIDVPPVRECQVRVTDSLQQPVSGAQLTVREASSALSVSAIPAIVSDAEGNAVMFLCEGEYEVYAESEGKGGGTARLSVGAEATPYAIQLRAGGRATLHLPAYDSLAVQRITAAMLVIELRGAMRSTMRTWVVGQPGMLHVLRDLPPGRYDVVVTLADLTWRGRFEARIGESVDVSLGR
jgi:hypothetical protein